MIISVWVRINPSSSNGLLGQGGQESEQGGEGKVKWLECVEERLFDEHLVCGSFLGRESGKTGVSVLERGSGEVRLCGGPGPR